MEWNSFLSSEWRAWEAEGIEAILLSVGSNTGTATDADADIDADIDADMLVSWHWEESI